MIDGSLGYAGNSAASIPGAGAVRIAALDPTDACVQSFTYPAARKLYVNTVKGFNLGQMQCEAAVTSLFERLPGLQIVEAPETMVFAIRRTT